MLNQSNVDILISINALAVSKQILVIEKLLSFYIVIRYSWHQDKANFHKNVFFWGVSSQSFYEICYFISVRTKSITITIKE